MERDYRISTQHSGNGFAGLEDLLAKSLVRITPKKDFIRDLKYRLMENYPHKIKREIPQWGVFAMASLVSGIILLVMGIRSVTMIASLFGVLNHYRLNKKGERPSNGSSKIYTLHRNTI